MTQTQGVRQCHSLTEVRASIDDLDAQIVALVAQRQGYVRQAAGFKQNLSEVPAPARVEAVIAKVVAQAQRLGAQPEVVEAMYRAMIAAFIAYETKQHQAGRAES
ncbi:MAG: chorismate mutase [Neisseriaceae bacterium]|nr:chorismate mutase [Neisseriaceae bacterium]